MAQLDDASVQEKPVPGRRSFGDVALEDATRSVGILSSRELASESQRHVGALRRLVRHFEPSSQADSTEGENAPKGVPLVAAGAVADVLRASVYRLDGEDRSEVRAWLARLLSAAAAPPVKESSVDAQRYYDGYLEMLAAMGELAWVPHVEVATAAIAAVAEVVNRLLPAEHDPLRTVLRDSGLVRALATAAERLSDNRSAVLDIVDLLLRLCGSRSTLVGQRSLGEECTRQMSGYCGDLLRCLEFDLGDPCLAPLLELLWTLCGAAGSPCASEVIDAGGIRTLRDLLHGILEKGHRAVDKDTRDDAMLLTLILARQPGAPPLFQECGFLGMLVDVAVAHERSGANGSGWPTGQRPPYVKGFNLTVSDADFALKQVATDIVLALVAGGGEKSGSGAGIPERRRGFEDGHVERTGPGDRGHHAPHAMFNDERDCLEYVLGTDFFERCLSVFAAPGDGGGDGDDDDGGDGNGDNGMRNSRARRDTRHPWTPPQLVELRLLSLRAIEACAKRSPSTLESIGAVDVLVSFWESSSASSASSTPYASSMMSSTGGSLALASGGGGLDPHRSIDPVVLGGLLSALSTCARHSGSLRESLGDTGCVEMAVDAAIACGIPGGVTQASDLNPPIEALRLVASLASGSRANAERVAGHRVQVRATGGEVVEASGTVAMCKLLRGAARTLHALDAGATLVVSELMTAISTCCASDPASALATVVDGDLVESLMDICEGGGRVLTCQALGVIAAVTDPNGFGPGFGGPDGHDPSAFESIASTDFDGDDMDSASADGPPRLPFAASAEEAVCDLDAWRSMSTERTARQVLFAMWRAEERLVGVDATEFDPEAAGGANGINGINGGAATQRSLDDEGTHGYGDAGGDSHNHNRGGVAAASGAATPVLPVTGVPTRLVPSSAVSVAESARERGHASPGLDVTSAASVISFATTRASIATAASGGEVASLQRDALAFGPGAPAAVLTVDLRTRIHAALFHAGILADTERGLLDADDAGVSLRCARHGELARREEWRRCVAELEAARVRPTTPDLVEITYDMESLEVAARTTRAEISAVRERTGADLRDEEGQFFRSLIDRARAEESELVRQKQERDPMWRLEQRKKGLASRAGEPRVARPAASNTHGLHHRMGSSGKQIGGHGPKPVNRGVFSRAESSVGSATGGSIKLPLTPAYATVPSGAPPKYAEVGRGGNSNGSAVPVATEAAMTATHRSKGSHGGGAGDESGGAGGGGVGGGDAVMAEAERMAVMGGYRFSSLPSAVNPARQRKKMSRAEREGQDRLLKVLGQEYLDEVL